MAKTCNRIGTLIPTVYAPPYQHTFPGNKFNVNTDISPIIQQKMKYRYNRLPSFYELLCQKRFRIVQVEARICCEFLNTHKQWYKLSDIQNFHYLCQIFLNNGKVEEFRNRFSFETSQHSHEMKWLQLQLIFVFLLQSLIQSVFLCLSQSNRLGPYRVPSRWNKFDSTIFVLFLFTANQPTQNPSASIALPVLVEK